MMAMLRSLLLLFVMFSMVDASRELSRSRSRSKRSVNLLEKCPFGWTNFGLRCYKFFSQSVNFVTAEKNCQSLDANLATAHNKAENDFLMSLLPSSSTRCWLGTHDGEIEGQWLWTDGSVFDFTNWCSGEPNNQGTENCAEINWTSNRCWNDLPCSFPISYICATDL